MALKIGNKSLWLRDTFVASSRLDHLSFCSSVSSFNYRRDRKKDRVILNPRKLDEQSCEIKLFLFYQSEAAVTSITSFTDDRLFRSVTRLPCTTSSKTSCILHGSRLPSVGCVPSTKRFVLFAKNIGLYSNFRRDYTRGRKCWPFKVTGRSSPLCNTATPTAPSR